MSERWAAIAGWEGEYEISDQGRVRSVTRVRPHGDGRVYTVPGKLLSPRPQMHGYLVVTLRRGKGTLKTARLHRLIAEAFIPNPGNKPNVNHIDCDPKNNGISNLEWCTQPENLAHMTALGRRFRHPKGTRSTNASLSDEVVRQIRQSYADGGTTHSMLAAQYGVRKSVVTSLLNRKTYAYVE